ncbi:hypothetical protein Osc7112_3525 [Oscillatoria nigro-viridis PCC 7112]|uniref:Uncharacterized protein n=1 Tax=Phormidium nigroviride PCC 7112 TaxID=179408 RepID=K9VIG4_9CYAN|nr:MULTISPECIES: hypothetical protein [Oscillatoriales]AFZ07893.1 hypothetical protein Osc7112_3525 [Oscillatoria nigro-viridis PCC 7112]MBE9122020.1 hypothetical protein [Tychonema sp. LEGE 07199]MBE9132957.1 hypothetical protein [Tychonema sp. LEGE 07196]
MSNFKELMDEIEQSPTQSVMSNFKQFMDDIKQSPTQSLPESDLTLPSLQMDLTAGTFLMLTPLSFSNNEKEKFSEEVSSLIQNESFLSDFSNQIGEPLQQESEDDFVKRASNRLREMLYERFGIKG